MKKLSSKLWPSKTNMPNAFSIAGLWAVARKLSKRGGQKMLSTAFTMYFCMRDSETPVWAKSAILGALGYLIFPMDFIPDAILGAGFTDDWTVILAAMTSVIAHIKDEHREKASKIVERFLGAANEQDPGEVPLPPE